MKSLRSRKTLVAIAVSTAAFAFVFASYILRPAVGATYSPADAASTYKSKCQSCHGADGKGQTAAGKKLHVKDFREFQGDRMPILLKGKGKMPAYGKALGDAKCKELVDYIQNTFK